MSEQRYTNWAVSLDAVDQERGTITGTAVRYNVDVPRGPWSERVLPGAFARQVADPARVSVLWQHDSDSPIGRVSALQDGDEELRFVAKITDHADVPEARKALALLDEGIIDEISVGFQWQKWTEERDDAGLTILHSRARLRELSVVTFGALGRDARVLTVASEATTPTVPPINVDDYRARLAALRA